MKITAGMACYDDFRGVEFSAMSLLLHHGIEELIVVDNNPQSEHGEATKAFCAKHREIRYVPMPEATGTTQPRERIFAEATGDAVLVLDCHVLFPGGAIARLQQYLAEHPDCPDLLQGPLVRDDGGCHTQFNDAWRSGMWGVWATAWHCPACRKQFTTLQVDGQVSYRDQPTSRLPAPACACRPYPPLAWPGHEKQLRAAGFRELGWSPEDPRFDIPAQGLGVFACRKDAWIGFNPHFRTFGGEEFYIHEKYRAFGRRTLCLPFLRWWHSFAKVGKGKFPNTSWGKMRNYVLGHQELRRDLAPVYEHFCTPQPNKEGKLVVKVPPDLWTWLLEDPIARQNMPQPTSFAALREQPPADQAGTLDQLFDWTRGAKRDLDQHFPFLRELAAKCSHVTEFTKRRESTVAFLAGRPQVLASYPSELDALIPAAARLAGETQVRLFPNVSSLDATIEPTDLLWLDTVHSAARLKQELDKHAGQVRRFIAVRGTGAYGAVAENKKEAGLFTALRPFVQDFPEWFVYYHTRQQYGLTVLGRLEEDRPQTPVLAWPPGKGPGTELQKILKSLGINPKPSCDCNGKAAQMDFWGVAGCREHRETIVGWMRAGQDKWGWTEKLRAAANAVASGLAFQLDVRDPFPALIDESIRRAEVAAAEEAAHAA